MNTRFVVRGTLLALTIVFLAMAAAVLVIGPNKANFPPDATPPRPTINVPRGDMPSIVSGLVEYSRYNDAEYNAVGCGFLLRVKGDVIGVTTAHSLSFGPSEALDRIAFGINGRRDLLIEFDWLHGQPGQARSGEDMTVDYVLLQPPANILIDPALFLTPDPRGVPQAGERVSMYSGLGDGGGGARVFEGTVQSASEQAVWVLMDEAFEPSGMSGSPFISQYTGKVIGMAIATTHRAGKVLLGLHPIGSLVHKAEAATELLKIADYRR